MSVKGFPTQKKLNTPIPNVTTKFTREQFQTLQSNYSDKVGADVNTQGLYRIGSVLTVTAANTASPKRAFTCTSHGGSIGDVVRFEVSSGNPGFEATILDVPDANTIVLGAEAPNNITNTDTFFILRYVMARYNDDGSAIVTATAGPIQFVLDGTDTEVEQDTGTPGNSIPLPTTVLDTNGVPQDVATLGEQQTQTTALGTISTNTGNTVTNTGTIAGAVSSARMQTNPIVGQSGVQGGSGTVSANTQRVVLATDVALPAGTNVIGALSANQSVNNAQVNGTTISVNSGATDAGTQRVVLSTTQPTLSVTSTNVYSDATASGNITTQNLTPTSTATAGSAVETAANGTNSRRSAIVTVTGTYTGALSYQVSADGSTWRTMSGAQTFYNISTGAFSATIASAANGDWQVLLGGYAYVRVTALAAVTGTAVVSLRTAVGGNGVIVQGPLPTGTNVIGALSSNQSVNVAQMNGVATSMGAGADGTGTQRVTVSNNASATLANVSASASSTTLLASSSTRRNATFYNDSTSILYLKLGATASSTSFTVILQAGGYYELPQPCYSGVIDGIWASATGSCRVTSW